MAAEPYQSIVERLEEKFVAELPNKLSKLRGLYTKLIATDVAVLDLEDFHRLTNSLTGSAKTFGMSSLSAATSELGNKVKEIASVDKTLDDSFIESLGEKLRQIELLAKLELEERDQISIRPDFMPELPHSPLVYLIEDNAATSTQLFGLLTAASYRVKQFGSLETFKLSCANSLRPDVIVLDVFHRKGRGNELISEINTIWPYNPPIVFVSDEDDLDVRLSAYRAGASRYMLKPLVPETLINLLDTLTNRAPANPYRVLIVDDDPLQSELQAATLASAGLIVQASDQPREAIQMMEAFQPDIVLLGIYLPEVSGPEFAAIIREREEYLNIPIIFLSADSDMSQQLIALKFGGDDYLIKPVNPEYLVSSVTTRARRSRYNRRVHERLQTVYYEREREHQALNQHAIVSITDAAGNITYVNNMFCKVSGYTERELVGKNHRLLKSGVHPDQFYHEMWDTIASGNIWFGEVCNQRKDGSLYWVESTITPFVNEAGQPYQYISIRTDITHIKEAEQQQRSQSLMMSLLVTVAADLLVANRATFNDCVLTALEKICKQLSAEHAYFIQLGDNCSHVSNVVEWAKPGISMLGKQILNKPPNALWWWSRIKRNEPVILSDSELLNALPHLDDDIHAVSILPIEYGNRLQGVLIFELNQLSPEWTINSLDKLDIMTGLIAAAMLRIEGESALAKSADELNATLESTNDAILAISDKGQILFVNHQFRQMWNLPDSDPLDGYTEASILKIITARAFHGDEQLIRQQIKLFALNVEFQTLLELQDGRAIEFHSVGLRHDNKLFGKVWSFHDMTERMRAEQAAEIAKERLHTGQVYANIGTWEWNVITDELYWTERIPALFGHPSGELETSYENFLAAIHPDDRQFVIDAVNNAINFDKPYNVEHRVVWPDGSIHWLVETGAVQRDEFGAAQRMLGVVQDITPLKEAQNTLIAAREEADRANQAKSEFLSSMSHELRTPMNAILGFGQLMEYDEGISAEHLDYVNEILKAGTHLLDLINEVLDLAKIESGKIELSLEAVDVESVFDECFSLLSPLAQQRDINLACTLTDNPQVLADRTRLKQVLINLLSNAIKYNKDGGKVWVETQQLNDKVLRITVGDTGCGIPEEQLDNIFLPFSRIHDNDEHIEGTGIGLTITSRIVEMMGGNIGVQSRPDEGSVFWIDLMLATERSDVHRMSRVHFIPDNVTDPTTESDTILYIEDNPSNMKLVAQIFAQLANTQLLIADTALQGLELARQHQPDLILLDINMPDMDGYQLLSFLRDDKQLKDIPVIAVTANAMARDREKGMNAGFNAYLSKPLDIDVFVEVVTGFLSDKSHPSLMD